MFRKTIREYYKKHKRSFPWRNTRNPYFILVSEVMLQQTQVGRVIPKYEMFIKLFPTISLLAKVSTRDVLGAWQGLGYNRRALYLLSAAQTIERDYGGVVPQDSDALQKLAGIGRNTAGAICVFAYNAPASFVETNIRSTFIHFFFKNRNKVRDKDIFPLVEKTIDVKNPREWYWALMDYGVMLKERHLNPSRKSTHYKKQGAFKGSHREKRGLVLKILIKKSSQTLNALALSTNIDMPYLKKMLGDLQKEGFITQDKNFVKISSH